MERKLAIKISNIKKRYNLGQIGNGTLTRDLQTWWALKRGKEDPNSKIGQVKRIEGDSLYALNGINMEIYQGEAVGIIGRNGAGKSTLLKLISQITAPTEGQIELYGRVASMLEVGTGFNGEMTGRENIYLNGAILGMSKTEIDQKIDDIIEFSEVKDFIDTPIKRYSSGMFVKLAFSVAAYLDSEILIMDEVLAVGDAAFQQKCIKRMKEAANKEGRTVIYVSHNMNTIRELCERCYVIEDGKVIYEGDVEKAIEIYLGGVSKNYPVHYSLLNTPRPTRNHGVELRINEFDFINKKTAIFTRLEKLIFQITYEAKIDIKGLKLYFIVKNQAGNAIGMAQTIKPFGDIRKGEVKKQKFEFDISNFAAGDYTFLVDIMVASKGGKQLSYDQPLQQIVFNVVDNIGEGIEWSTRYFGSIHLNNIVALKENED